ncbi:MAG: hypothetical protein HY770_02230 [Chitinivibrionia bacterium]|nr:hypothetical protein [Chitinivibrionia bacterium]
MSGKNTDVYLGRLVKAFWIKGEVKFHPSDDFWDPVLESRELRIVVESSRRRTDPASER